MVSVGVYTTYTTKHCTLYSIHVSLGLILALSSIAMHSSLCLQMTTLSTSHTLSLSATASSIAEEALAAIATVKAFCAEDEETERCRHTSYYDKRETVCSLTGTAQL